MYDYDDVDENDDSVDYQTADSIQETIKSTLVDELPDNISLGVILSPSPTGDWTDRIKPRFKIGDLVVYSTKGNVKPKSTYAMKISSLGTKPDTYMVINSGCRNEYTVDGNKLEMAAEGSKWESYFEKSNVLNVPGLKISCPSNDMFRKATNKR